MIKTITAALLSVGLATGAHAATVAGSSSGVFTSETGGSTGLIGATDGAAISADGKTLTWPGETCGILGCTTLTDQSTLTINDVAFSKSTSVGNNEVTVGSLTWYNASSSSLLTPDLFTAVANIGLNFTSPTGQVGSETLTFNINNTTNPTGDLIMASPTGALDFGLAVPLNLGSGLTLTSFFAEEVGPGSLSGGTWSLGEGLTSTVMIKANIAAIPLPAGGLLLLTGLGGLAALRRRKQAA
ncbi:MAG: choice-of-anchor K domain-containing protein [Pseudomonadota bacterium]|uniref:choice-of-anchor K domain-containing protein n=1 Tax=Roseovarius TaxID=74030 RepID=UPI0022A77346|nr:choice-of-anchor K domain-containing protein [Roseovarius sp. EGI FJ00037]MCZ0810752.1 VPLPA-CTERM sorting domain-containing protein [Roseovarius sp. EGI FJ00037]